MPDYRKKPVVISAFQFEWGCRLEPWFVDAIREGAVDDKNDHMEIKTLEGVMRAERGDWIIRGVKGEFYPCRDDIFRMTYEAVDAA